MADVFIAAKRNTGIWNSFRIKHETPYTYMLKHSFFKIPFFNCFAFNILNSLDLFTLQNSVYLWGILFAFNNLKSCLYCSHWIYSPKLFITYFWFDHLEILFCCKSIVSNKPERCTWCSVSANDDHVHAIFLENAITLVHFGRVHFS